MATCESSNDSFESRHPKKMSSATLTRAVDLFVMTKFEKCLQECSDVIKSAKCEPEQERNNEVIEAAAALGIQALAEMDQWHDTISFITEVYGGIHLCTARIVQVCILLHAHVKEYLPCHKMVKIWLTHPDNMNSKQCAQVIRVYSEHILLPLGQFGILEEIVNNCKSFSEEEKAALLVLPQSGRYKDAKNIASQREVMPSQLLFSPEGEENEIESIEALEVKDGRSYSTCSSKSRQPDSSPQDPVNLLAICKRLYSSFLGSMKSSWRDRFIFLVMAAFAIWALIQTQTGDPVSSLDRLVTLWQGLLQRIKFLTTNS